MLKMRYARNWFVSGILFLCVCHDDLKVQGRRMVKREQDSTLSINPYDKYTKSMQEIINALKGGDAERDRSNAIKQLYSQLQNSGSDDVKEMNALLRHEQEHSQQDPFKVNTQRPVTTKNPTYINADGSQRHDSLMNQLKGMLGQTQTTHPATPKEPMCGTLSGPRESA